MVNRIRAACLPFLLALLWCSPAAGQPARVSAYAHADSSSYLVGDLIMLRVDLLHPKGTVLGAVLGDSAGGFLVLERRPVVPTSDTTSSTAFVVSKYDSGLATFPSVDFSVTVPGEPAARTVSTNPVVLTVRTVPVDTSKDIRDLKPPMSIPMSLAEILSYSSELRSMTAGRGSYTMKFSHYEEVPSHIAQGIIEQAQAQREEGR